MPERKPIFYDQERRRWRRTRRVLEITGGLFTLILVVFVVNVFRKPELPDILSAATHWNIHAVPAKLKSKTAPRGRKRKVAALGKLPQNYDPLRAAFYVADDPTSLASLKLHYHDIDLLIPEALHAVFRGWASGYRAGPETFIVDADRHDRAAGHVHGQQLRRENLGQQEMAEMLANPAARERLSKSLSDFASAQRQSGIVVDFEGVPQTSQPDFSRFIHDLAITMHAANLKLMVAVPAADWSYDYKYLASQADAIILMNYDLHYPTSDAGPIAPQDFFERNIENIVKIVPPEKIVMGIANYGYDWPAKSKKVPHPIAQPVTFQQGIITAVESESDVTFDPDSLNPHYSYEDEKNQIHNVWMLDGVTAYNELRAAERAGVRGHGPVAPGYGRSFDLVHLGRHAFQRRDSRKTRGSSARLRFDSGRRGRYLAHHRDTAERPPHLRLRCRPATSSMTSPTRVIRFPGASSRWAQRRTKWR